MLQFTAVGPKYDKSEVLLGIMLRITMFVKKIFDLK